MSTLHSIVLAGGGTGGHIEPALALADYLRRRDPKTTITALGTSRGLETTLVPARGYPLELIPAVPMPRRPGRDLLALPFNLARSVKQAKRVMQQVQAQVVVGFGGYVALPAYLAARRLKIPIVVHEVNSPVGLANRIGSRLTPFVARGWEHVPLKAPVVGVPLRQSISSVDRLQFQAQARLNWGLATDRMTLVVTGGSQGATSLNQAVTDAAADLIAAGVQILHAVGPKNDLPDTSRIPGYVCVPYIEDMAAALCAADVMVCRGGGMTCAELTAVGVPAIYVPLPWGNGEQRRNAQAVVDAGGGLVIENSQLSAASLTSAVKQLVDDPERVRTMSQAAYNCGRRDGDAALAALVDQALAAQIERTSQ